MTIIRNKERRMDLMSNYLPLEAAAAQLRLTPKTLDRWYARNEGPPRFYIGRRAYYDVEKFKAWVETEART